MSKGGRKKESALYKGMGIKLSDIVIGDTLGTGTFSRVRIARHKASGKYLALKILKKAEIIRLKQVDHTMSEKAILQKINHPMIITLYGTSQDDLHLCMYMEFVSGGELFSHLRRAGRFTNDTGKFFAASIILAMQHLHGT